MSGSITRALDWNVDIEQQYLAVIPTGDEVLLYQTNTSATKEEDNVVKIHGRSGFDQIQCVSFSSADRGLTSVGQINGIVNVFDITNSSSSVLKLKPKQSRSCNSVSFNNNGLIAAGFDKGRQDNSVQIWNIEHYSKTSNNDHIKRPTYSYVPNEAVSSVVFHPSYPTNLLAGSYKFLREIDIRVEAPVFQLATRCTSGILIDPFESNFFSSFSEDGSLSVWDRRKLTSSATQAANINNASSTSIIAESPIFYYTKLLSDSTRKSQSPCFKYSTIRKGEFSAVFAGDLIRRWQIGYVPPFSNVPEDKQDTQSISQLQSQNSQLFKSDEPSLFVSSVLDVKTKYERVISYDYSPSSISDTSSCLVCMRQSGSVFKMDVTESLEAVEFNSFNEFSICGPSGSFTRFAQDDEVTDEQEAAKLKSESNSAEKDDISEITVSTELNDQQDNSEMGEEDDADEEDDGENLVHNGRRVSRSLGLDNFIDVCDVLNNDIASVMRKRSLQGYGLDCVKNVSILESSTNVNESYWFLRNTWKWMILAKKSLDKGNMIAEGLDLGFQGVLGLWNGASGLIDQNRYNQALPIGDKLFSQAIESIVSAKGQKTANISISGNSDKKLQRKLCLDVAGWDFGAKELDQKLNTLISMGMYEKAAGWAVFNGDVSRAVDILASAKKERLRIISTAVAGYLAYKDSPVNSPWKDRCRKMASELDDPYLRSIFAFIADNNWQDILDEHSLPLRERLGVALRFLPDKDLTVYLNKVSEKVIKRGDLEGIIITGITPQGIDLLQSYVDRTSDVQTASLIASFGCPRYFSDERVTHWVESYRVLLNSWSLFNVRAKFDVARTKLSKTFAGQIMVKTPPRQVYLQCIKCNKNISKPPKANRNMNTNNMKQFTKNATIGNDKKYKACSHCGAPLPRCAVCLLSLGMPMPSDNTVVAIPTSPEAAVFQHNEKHFKEWFSFCLGCNHASHAFHAEEWFSKHYVCPVPDCDCRCNSK